MPRFRFFLTLIPLTIAVLVAVALAVWFFRRDAAPASVAIATGEPGGLYNAFGEAFARCHQPRSVEIRNTAGSVENRELILSGEVDLALIQAGSVSLNGMSVIAPVHRDLVFVIVRKDAGIQSLDELNGKEVILGPPGSGMRSSGSQVLEHYGLAERIVDRADLKFTELPDHPEVTAAIVTTGDSNPALRDLLEKSEFELWSVNAPAIARERPFFREINIPKGFFSENPRIPAEDVATVATTALLVAREDAPGQLVSDALDTLYKQDFGAEFPQLISHDEAAELSPLRLHHLARQYFDPFDRVGFLASVMESIAATKEIIVALIAVGLLTWDGLRRMKKRAKARLAQAQKDRLDALLERTFLIERQQREVDDPEKLRRLLDQLTDIKLRALEELTHEDLRGDQCFAIFLMQCAGVINKIQLKLLLLARQAPGAQEEMDQEEMDQEEIAADRDLSASHNVLGGE